MILLILQIVLAVFVFVYIGDIQIAAAKMMDRLWDNRENNMQFWNTIQTGVSTLKI